MKKIENNSVGSIVFLRYFREKSTMPYYKGVVEYEDETNLRVRIEGSDIVESFEKDHHGEWSSKNLVIFFDENEAKEDFEKQVLLSEIINHVHRFNNPFRRMKLSKETLNLFRDDIVKNIAS